MPMVARFYMHLGNQMLEENWLVEDVAGICRILTVADPNRAQVVRLNPTPCL